MRRKANVGCKNCISPTSEKGEKGVHLVSETVIGSRDKDPLMLELSPSKLSSISIDLSAVLLQMSASCAMALILIRSASLNILRLTPTRALSSDFRVDSHAASSARASSSLAECAPNALSDVGVFLLLSLTSWTWEGTGSEEGGTESGSSVQRGNHSTHPANEYLSVSEDNPYVCLSRCDVLETGAVVCESDEVGLLGVKSLVEQLADTVRDSEHIGLSILRSPAVQSVVGGLAGVCVGLEAVLHVLLRLDEPQQQPAIKRGWPRLHHLVLSLLVVP